ncbi:hypothetical protein EST54_16840, partial [Streptomyces sioyaensis]
MCHVPQPHRSLSAPRPEGPPPRRSGDRPGARSPQLLRALGRLAPRLLAAAAVCLLLTGAAALLATAPAAAAQAPGGRPISGNPAAGDNCAYAGTAPPVDVPTGFPMPHGWHFPCTRTTPPAPPTHPPAPRPRTPRP